MPKIREFIEADRERVLAVTQIYTGDSGDYENLRDYDYEYSNYHFLANESEDASFEIQYPDHLRGKFVRKNDGFIKAETRVEFPLLISDLYDPSRIKKLLQAGDKPVVMFGKYFEGGKELNSHKSGEIENCTKILNGIKIISANKDLFFVWGDVPKIVKDIEDYRALFVPPTKESVKEAWLVYMQKAIKRQIEEAEENIELAKKRLLTANQKAGPVFMLRNLITEHSGSVIDKTLEQVAQLASVEKLEFTGSCQLLITTKELYSDSVIHRGTNHPAYYMGKWEIEFALNRGTVRARNIAAHQKEFQNVHQQAADTGKLSQSNYTCLGGYHSLFCEAFRRLDYVSLVSNVVEFLRTITFDDFTAARNVVLLKTRLKVPHEFKFWLSLIEAEDI